MTHPRDTTARPFRRKEPDARALTSERIAHDLAAFASSGGHIEVLGVTRVLTKVDDQAQAITPTPAPARARNGRR